MTRHPHTHGLLHRLRSLYLWHRYLGLTVAILALWLAISGILLNHSHDLALDSEPVQADWLLNAYGITAPPARAFKLEDHWFIQIGTQLYLDTQPVGECAGTLQRAVVYQQFIIAICPRSTIIFMPDGTQVDSLPVPAPIRNAGISHQGELIIRTPAGNYQLGDNLLAWQAANSNLTLSQPTIAQLPPALYQQLAQSYRGQSLSWERVLLDAHSGRLAGTLGVWLVDAAGVVLILLALSGILVWLKRRRSRRKK